MPFREEINEEMNKGLFRRFLVGGIIWTVVIFALAFLEIRHLKYDLLRIIEDPTYAQATHWKIVASFCFIWFIGIAGLGYTLNHLIKTTTLAISEEKHRSIVENSNDVILLQTLSGKILDVNDRATELYGYSREELIGQQISDVISTKKPSSVKQANKNKLLAGEEVVYETTDRHKEGYEIPVEVSGRLVSREGDGIIQVFIRDIRERKEAERELIETNQKLAQAVIDIQEMAYKAEEANQAKSAFLSNMSHEIRTPMNAVIGMSEILEELIQDPQQKKYLEILKNNGKHLLSLVNDILDLSKIESGKIELIEEDVCLCDMFDEVGEIYRPLAEGKGIELVIYSPRRFPHPCGITIDIDKLRQILVNLIGNAIKFTDTGTITVDAMIVDGPELKISVQDTGKGIDERQLTNIFEAFQQGTRDGRNIYSGTGLGLTISKELVELMGGRIEVKSIIGKGSTFTVRVPFRPAEASIIKDKIEGKEQCRDKEVPADDPVAKNPIRILMAEDIEDNIILFQAYLKKENLVLDIARDGLEALKQYKSVMADPDQEPYALVLMDIQMPVMDGYESCRSIRDWEKKEGLEPVPMYSLTAFALKEEELKSMAVGCSGHLTKPIMKKTLIEVINRHRS